MGLIQSIWKENREDLLPILFLLFFVFSIRKANTQSEDDIQWWLEVKKFIGVVLQWKRISGDSSTPRDDRGVVVVIVDDLLNKIARHLVQMRALIRRDSVVDLNLSHSHESVQSSIAQVRILRVPGRLATKDANLVEDDLEMFPIEGVVSGEDTINLHPILEGESGEITRSVGEEIQHNANGHSANERVNVLLLLWE
jgi:hypothetical protein